MTTVRQPAAAPASPGPAATAATREEALQRMADRLEAAGLGADAYTQVAGRTTAAGKAYAATRAVGASVAGNLRGALWFTGILSVGWNLGAVLLRKSSVPDAGAAVAGDLLSNVVGGAAGATVSTLGTIALGSVMGAGPALTIASVVLGFGTFYVADRLVKGSEFYKATKAKVREALS
ncbi:MAG: hypothetical protein VKS61_07200 [Candidatus Sericytochromatia bacterium]|nr:hypothetical protein [Candidatus Sericytochromatia bacterium]